MNQIIGHENILEMLVRTARENRPAHSYLFTGVEGTGKKLVGIRFASLLNCLEPLQDPHGDCTICRRIRSFNHPDFEIVQPDRGSIRIEQVRRLQNFFKFPPYEGRWRVALINDAHLLTRAAQNALLKTMEEPPVGRTLTLVTSKPHLLLPTVRSRCRRIRFGPLSSDAVSSLLQANERIPKEKAKIIASMAGGSISEAVRLNTKRFTEMRKRLLDMLAGIGSSGWGELMESSSLVSADPETARESLRIIGSWLRDLLYVKSVPEDAQLINQDFLALLRKLGDSLTVRQILESYEELVRALELVESEINVNRNLVMDVMFARLANILSGRRIIYN